MQRWPPWLARIRDTLLFLVGLAGVIYEAGFTETERYGLLVVYLVMMGLPIPLAVDARRRLEKAREQLATSRQEES